MRSKLLLLVLSFAVLLFSCKKDKTPQDNLADTKKQIIGTWEAQSTTITYYDASGKVVETDNSNTNDGVQFQFINETTLKEVGQTNDNYA